MTVPISRIDRPGDQTLKVHHSLYWYSPLVKERVSADPSTVVDEIEMLYRTEGSEPYGERITMREHMLLTARAAELAGADYALIAACLLHDVGHLLVEPDDEYGKHSHDYIGAEWVADRFPPIVSEPVRHHVAAKRYLCAVDPGYHDQLSAASRHTLSKQGGPMTSDEVEAFQRVEYFEEAVQLRRWEDVLGKLDEATVPTFDRYRPALEKLVIQ